MDPAARRVELAAARKPIAPTHNTLIVILFHRTELRSAESILKNGFIDGPSYSELLNIAGVWLSDRPVDCNEGTKGDVLVELQIDLQDAELADFEVIEHGKPYREWCVPAVLVNQNAAVHCSGVLCIVRE